MEFPTHMKAFNYTEILAHLSMKFPHGVTILYFDFA
jgi:hypothetical protein